MSGRFVRFWKSVRVQKSLIAATCLGTAIACIFPTDSCACTLARPSGAVFGRVTRASGAPANGILIRARAAARACPATVFDARLVAPDTTRTIVTGDYELRIALQDGSPTAACVQLTAERAGDVLATTTPVTLSLQGPPNDVVRVNIVVSD